MDGGGDAPTTTTTDDEILEILEILDDAAF